MIIGKRIQRGRGYAGIVVSLSLFLGSFLLGSNRAVGADSGLEVGFVDDIDALTQEANGLLNLRAGTIVTLALDQTRGAAITVVVPLARDQAWSVGRQQPPVESLYTLELWPYSIRAPGFEVKAQLADGSLVTMEPGPVRTLRGGLFEIDGSAAAGSLLEDGLHATILLPDGDRYWIEPLGSRILGAAGDEYIVYRDEDVIPSGGTCMIADPGAAANVADHETDGVALLSSSVTSKGPRTALLESSGTRRGSLYVAELACDADFEYFQNYGSVQATQDQIESIINGVNLQYGQDVAIEHFITTIIVRTAEPDPYSSSTPSTLLNQFRNYWLSNHGDIPRDAAQLFTGRDLTGPTIGIAWLAGICGTRGYSVVQSDCCSGFGCKTDLSAHELGHNWNADHCSCSGWTMNTSLTCANQFHPTSTIPEIIAYRDTRTCLAPPDELLAVRIFGQEELEENTAAQYTAMAIFLSGMVDVTNSAVWEVVPPSAGSITAGGLFTAGEVDADLAVSIIATFSDEDTTVEDDLTVTIIDTGAPVEIVSSSPPDDAIDARQPFAVDGSDVSGWQAIELTFSGDAGGVTADDFTVSQEGGALPPPSIATLTSTTSDTIRLEFSGIIESGAWTTITHDPSGSSARLGFLPADVNGDATSSPTDILALIDALNEVGDPLPDFSTDVNRSGQPDPSDILRVIDLLNGAGPYDAWNGVSLP